MPFIFQRDPASVPHCCLTPYTSKAHTPGDIWRCDDCGQNHIWSPSDTYVGWGSISARRANKELKRYLKDKPFKQACGHGRGPG